MKFKELEAINIIPSADVVEIAKIYSSNYKIEQSYTIDRKGETYKKLLEKYGEYEILDTDIYNDYDHLNYLWIALDLNNEKGDNNDC